MIHNLAELNETKPIESYENPPTWVESFRAATKTITSVGLSSSSQNYFSEQMEKDASEWKKIDPDNERTYDIYSGIQKKHLREFEDLYAKDMFRVTSGLDVGAGSVQAKAFLKFKELQKIHGWRGFQEAEQSSFDKAKQDYMDSIYIELHTNTLIPLLKYSNSE